MKKLILAIATIAGSWAVKAQFVPVNPFASSPLAINPAAAGAFQNKDARLFANHLNRFSSQVGNAFVYNTFSADMPILNKRMGIGLMSTFNTPGAIGILESNFLLATSYHQPLDAFGSHNLAFGLQAGVLTKSINLNNLTFDNQYMSGIGYVPGLTSRENLANTQITNPDFNFGVMYYGDFGKIKPWIGASMFHISSPTESFFANNANRVPRRLSGNLGLDLAVNDKFSVIPQAIYVSQKDLTQITGGLTARYAVNPEVALQAGGFYRTNDAILASVGLEVKDLAVLMNYNINQNKDNLAGMTNGFEVSLRYLVGKGSKKKTDAKDEDEDSNLSDSAKQVQKAIKDSVKAAKAKAKEMKRLADAKAKAREAELKEKEGRLSESVKSSSSETNSQTGFSGDSSLVNEINSLKETNKELIQTNRELIELLRSLMNGGLSGGSDGKDSGAKKAKSNKGPVNPKMGEIYKVDYKKIAGKVSKGEQLPEEAEPSDTLIAYEELTQGSKLTPQAKARGLKEYERRIAELIRVNRSIKTDYEALKKKLQANSEDNSPDDGSTYYYVVVGAYKQPMVRNTFMRALTDRHKLRTYVTQNEDEGWDIVYTTRYKSKTEATKALQAMPNLDPALSISGNAWIWRSR